MASECPVTLNHTLGPEGYLARYDWAQTMLKTHRQKRCRTCGLWCIWEPKATAESRDDTMREQKQAASVHLGPTPKTDSATEEHAE